MPVDESRRVAIARAYVDAWSVTTHRWCRCIRTARASSSGCAPAATARTSPAVWPAALVLVDPRRQRVHRDGRSAHGDHPLLRASCNPGTRAVAEVRESFLIDDDGRITAITAEIRPSPAGLRLYELGPRTTIGTPGTATPSRTATCAVRQRRNLLALVGMDPDAHIHPSPSDSSPKIRPT